MADVVAVLDHDRQRDQRHGDDRGRHRAGDGAEHRADENNRIRQPAADAAEQLSETFQQIFGKAAALENGTHQGEKRNGQQQVVAKHRFQLENDVAEKVRADQAQFDADEAEEQPHGGEREGRRVAIEHEQDQPHEHQGRQIMVEEIDHCTGFS